MASKNVIHEPLVLQTVAQNQHWLDIFMFNFEGNILDALLNVEGYPYFKRKIDIKNKNEVKHVYNWLIVLQLKLVLDPDPELESSFRKRAGTNLFASLSSVHSCEHN